MNSQVRRYLEGKIDEIEILSLRQIQEIFSQFKLIMKNQEQEVESRLRKKYIQDSAALSEAQKAGLVDAEGQLVGELDGNGFGIGVAPFSSKPNSPRSAKKPKSR
ncbi:unnamed protein product, partial [Staurois parvus]